MTTTYKDDVILYVSIARPCFGAHHFLHQKSNAILAVRQTPIKTSSTRIVKSKGHDAFSWQSGYGAFSVSQSARESVFSYIAKQEIHHRKINFQDEFRALLNKHEIRFEERYVWD